MFTLEKGVSPNVVKVALDCSKKKEHWFLLSGDRHHDNPHCNHELEKRHLDEALEREAGIIDIGDLFCAMQGKYDKRSNKSDIRPEHQNGEYLDSLVNTAADFYEPYAKNIVALGYGNHETSILGRHETNLTERLAQALRTKTGAVVPVTGYTGWIKFLLDDGSGHRTSRVLWHMHGYGGGGPVTQDTIQAQRQNAYVDGADIMLSGHVHQRWVQENMKVYLDSYGEVKQRSSWYVKTSTYKEEYGSGVGGWHVGTGKPPKPLGAWWLKLTYDMFTVKKQRRVVTHIELTPTSGA
jgi:hypothetical protein